MAYFVCPECGGFIPTDSAGKERKYFKDHLQFYHRADILRNYADLFSWATPIYDQLDKLIDESILVNP